MIKAIVFDCFGVLYPQATGEFFEKHKSLFTNHALLDELNIEIDLGQITRRELYTRLLERTDLSVNHVIKEIDEKLIFDPKLIDLIKKLKSKYKIGLLSNAGEEEIEIIYRDKLDSLFDAIIVSYREKLIKPDPEIFRVAARELKMELSECIFTDDSQTNIEAAKNLGMQTIFYPRFGVIPEELEKFPTLD